MSFVIDRVTKQVIESAHTPDYDPTRYIIYQRADAAKIAVFKALLVTTPIKYIAFDGSNSPSAMKQPDRDAVDAAEAKALSDQTAAVKAVEDAKAADPAVVSDIAAKTADQVSESDLWVLVKSLNAKV